MHIVRDLTGLRRGQSDASGQSGNARGRRARLDDLDALRLSARLECLHSGVVRSGAKTNDESIRFRSN